MEAAPEINCNETVHPGWRDCGTGDGAGRGGAGGAWARGGAGGRDGEREWEGGRRGW